MKDNRVRDWLILIIGMGTVFCVMRYCTGKPDGNHGGTARDSTIAINAVKDSMAQERIDSLQSVIESQSEAIDSLRGAKNIVMVRYRTLRERSTDTLLVAVTDTLIAQEEALIGKQDSIIVSQRIQLTLCDNQKRYKDETIQILYENIKDFQAEIEEQKPSWWARNKFWIGVASGAVLTTAVLHMSQ